MRGNFAPHSSSTLFDIGERAHEVWQNVSDGSVAMTLFSGISYAGTAGVFRLPYDSHQQWPPPCTQTGFKLKADLVFMEFSATVGKYHLAEDWNGICGGDTDKGAPLYAIADGVVENASMIGASGGWLLTRHPLPDGTSRWVLYEHVLDIVVSSGQVYAGQLLAHLGNGNGAWEYHLHFEMRRSLFADLKKDPYYNPLTTQTALLYSSPSLFIDDRKDARATALYANNWTYIPMSANAPGSTAYVEVNGLRLSLQRAATLGFIYQYVYVQISGLWYYYPDITKVVFNAGNTYAVYGFTSNATLNILVPGHQYKDDRAKIDMIRSVNGNSNFTRVYTQYISTWSDSSFDYWMMVFSNDNSSALRYSYVEQATYRSNPLIRYTTYQDPITGSWTSWVQVNPNTLD